MEHFEKNQRDYTSKFTSLFQDHEISKHDIHSLKQSVERLRKDYDAVDALEKHVHKLEVDNVQKNYEFR